MLLYQPVAAVAAFVSRLWCMQHYQQVLQMLILCCAVLCCLVCVCTCLSTFRQVRQFYTAPTAIRSLMRAGDLYVKEHLRDSLRILGSVGEPINPEAWRW